MSNSLSFYFIDCECEGLLIYCEKIMKIIFKNEIDRWNSAEHIEGKG